MARTDRFRQQHNELLVLTGELQLLLNETSLSQDASAARACLGKIMGKLSLHIATEDKVLYPELVAHKDPLVANLARRFSTEMESTSGALAAYNGRWGTASAIKENPRAFIKETKEIVHVLADRIRRENQELYAAADRSEGQSF